MLKTDSSPDTSVHVTDGNARRAVNPLRWVTRGFNALTIGLVVIGVLVLTQIIVTLFVFHAIKDGVVIIEVPMRDSSVRNSVNSDTTP